MSCKSKPIENFVWSVSTLFATLIVLETYQQAVKWSGAKLNTNIVKSLCVRTFKIITVVGQTVSSRA